MADVSSTSRLIPLLDLLLKGQHEIKSRLDTLEADQKSVLEHIQRLDDVCIIQEEIQGELDTLSKTVERTHRKIRQVTRHLESNNIRGNSRSSSLLNLTDTRRRPSYDSDDTDDTVQDGPSNRDRKKHHTGPRRELPRVSPSRSDRNLSFDNDLRPEAGTEQPPNQHQPTSLNIQQQQQQRGFSNIERSLQHDRQTEPFNMHRQPVPFKHQPQPEPLNLQKQPEPLNQHRQPEPLREQRQPEPLITHHDQPAGTNITPSKQENANSRLEEDRPNIFVQPRPNEPTRSENPSTGTKPEVPSASNAADIDPEEGGATSAKGVRVDFSSPESYLSSLDITVTDPNIQRAIHDVFTEEGPDQTLNRIPGLRTVVLLDASNSVNSQMMEDLKRFFSVFVDEVENSASDYSLEETMAVAQFGGKCSIAQHFTNDYAPLRESIDTILRGGKSPLLMGLIMVTAYLHKYGKSVTVEGRVVQPRIIVVSDGLLTNHENVGTEQDFEANAIRCQSKVFEFLGVINQLGYTISCVGIGEYNKEFLSGISRQCKGRCFDGNGDNTESARLLAKYYRYQKPMTRICNEMARLGESGDIVNVVNKVAGDKELNDDDREEIIKLCNIQFNIKRKSVEPPPPEPKPPVQPTRPEPPPPNIPTPVQDEWESDNEGLADINPAPCGRTMKFGSRVKRGDNWPRDWESHDNGSMGTVVAHRGEGRVVVKWDNKNIHTYDQHRLARVSDYRTLDSSETMEVGCKVKRGVDWNRGDEDGGPDTEGWVLRKHRNKTVTVMWPIGIMETYRFGQDGKYDLEVVAEGTQTSSIPPEFYPPTSSGVTSPEATVIAWQWKDDQDQWRTLSEEESAKIQSHVDGGVSGTLIIQHGGIQLRCDVNRQKYQEIEGRRRSGALRRYEGTADEIASLRFIEQMS